MMLKQGKPMQYVPRQLGHEKIDMTIRMYAHFKPGVNHHYANDLAARIESLEDGGSAPHREGESAPVGARKLPANRPQPTTETRK